MNQHFRYSEQIDRYLKNKLSAEEKLAFDEKIRQDPLLQSEVNLQQEVFQAIGETRKASIKARLNQLPVEQSPWFAGSPFRVAAIVSGLVIASWGTYIALSPSESDIFNTVDIAEATSGISFSRSAEEKLQAPKPNIISISDPIPDAVVAAPDENTLTADVRSSTTEIVTRETPKVQRPAVTENFSENEIQLDYSDFELPQKQALQSSTVGESNVSIERVSNGEYSFHYQFYGDKLFLHGSFDEEPYKIIALNTEEGRSLFLEYAHNFYLLEEKRAVSPLIRVQDRTLVKELHQLSTTN